MERPPSTSARSPANTSSDTPTISPGISTSAPLIRMTAMLKNKPQSNSFLFVSFLFFHSAELSCT